MCTLCSQIAPIATECVIGSDETPPPPMATIFEGADASASNDTGTNYSIDVGDSFRGELDTVGDRDWVAVTLTEGTLYSGAVLGSESGGGTLSDPYLRVYDSSGNQVDFNDDGGPGFEPYLEFSATYTGTYYFEVAAYNDGFSGTYDLQVEDLGNAPPPPPPPGEGTIDELADYLTDGFWSFFGGGARDFSTSSATTSITVNISSLSSAGQQLATWAFETWEMVANIDFVVTTGSADIRFQNTDSGAYAGPDTINSDGTPNDTVVNISSNWLSTYGTGLDSYSFQTYIHEIGHALGLGHQGGYNGNARYGTDETFSNDSWQMSVMSYFSQTDNTSIDASYGLTISAMMADIVAIQNLYGAPGSSSQTGGDTTWGVNSNVGGYLGTLFGVLFDGETAPSGFLTEGEDMAFTIYDQGGIDTVDTSNSTFDDYISLLSGTFSNYGGLIGNVGIAVDTLVENATSGSGDDTIIGNYVANTIFTGNGADSIQAGAGWDTVLGGNGNDTVRGGDGNDFVRGGGQADRLFGEANNDTLYGESGNDYLEGGGGNDRLWGGADSDTIYGGDGNDRMGGDAGVDRLWGGGGNDTVFGGVGNDRLYGEGGADRLWGGDNNDSVYGGAGNDILGGGSANDRIFGADDNDTLFGDGGNDIVGGDAGDDLMFGGAGRDTMFGGIGNDTMQGQDGDDRMWGFRGADSMTGGDGIDWLGGGGGFDTLDGQAGDDVLFADNDGALMTGGSGADRFQFLFSSDFSRITDFDVSEGDTIALDRDLFAGNLSRQQIVDTFGDVSGGNITLTFDSATILVSDFTDLNALADQIVFFN